MSKNTKQTKTILYDSLKDKTQDRPTLAVCLTGLGELVSSLLCANHNTFSSSSEDDPLDDTQEDRSEPTLAALEQAEQQTRAIIRNVLNQIPDHYKIKVVNFEEPTFTHISTTDFDTTVRQMIQEELINSTRKDKQFSYENKQQYLITPKQLDVMNLGTRNHIVLNFAGTEITNPDLTQHQYLLSCSYHNSSTDHNFFMKHIELSEHGFRYTFAVNGIQAGVDDRHERRFLTAESANQAPKNT